MRTSRSLLALTAAAALTITLAACGDSSKPTAKSTSAAPSAALPTSAMVSSAATTPAPPAPATSQAPAASAAAAAAASSGDAAGDPGPAAEGATISAMTGRTLPAENMGWTFKAGTGNGDFYKKDGDLIGAQFRPGMDYEQSISFLKNQTPAGTGVCGSSSSTGLVCYLKAADGLVVINTDTTVMSADEVVTFANVLTKQLGTA